MKTGQRYGLGKVLLLKKRIILMMQKRNAICFLGIVMVIGLITAFSYGFYLDEDNEQRILYSNIKEYLIQFGAEDAAFVKEMTDLGLPEISVFVDRDHGVAVYYPAFAVWYINQLSPYAGSVFWHIYTWLLVLWGMCSLYFLGRELFRSDWLAGATVLLFFLTPRMFAESHYNNKDVVLLSMVFSMLYYGFRLMRKPTVKYALLLALTGALATNMKIVGAWTFGIVGLYCLFFFLAKKKWNRKILGLALLCVCSWAAIYLLLTPAAWKDIGAFLEYLISYAADYSLWHEYVLYGGKMIHQEYTGMPRKYLPVMMLLTIPVGILVLAVVGGTVVMYRLFRYKRWWDEEGYICLALVNGLVPLIYAVLAATPIYNGWRHFYFVYASVILAAGYGCYCLWKLAGKHGRKKLIKCLGAVYFAGLFAGIVVNHPQEHCYYNFLAGDDVVERYELDYWDLSAKQALERISRDIGEGNSGTVGVMNHPTLWGVQGNYRVQKKSIKKKIKLIESCEKWREAEYVIVNTTYAVMYNKEEYEEIKNTHELVDDICSYGNPICEIYRNAGLYD